MPLFIAIKCQSAIYTNILSFSYDYDVWGNFLIKQETIHNPFTYFCQTYDESTGLYYLRARYYDPTTGRFTQQDPAEDGYNWYVYGNSNPILYVDPTGFITVEEQQMYENGQMAPMAYSYLMNLTYQWWLADSQSSRDTYHQWAEDFRANGYTTTNGLFPEVDAGIAYMPTKPSNRMGAIPLTMNEHYFRNKLNLNFSQNQLIKMNERLPDNMKWTTVIASFHQNNKIYGKENIKYVSYDGHFELIYNGNGTLQIENNNPADMGTYNYYSPTNDAWRHTYYDVIPYFEYGNVR